VDEERVSIPYWIAALIVRFLCIGIMAFCGVLALGSLALLSMENFGNEHAGYLLAYIAVGCVANWVRRHTY